MELCSSLSNWVLLICVLCILGSSISTVSEPSALESSVKATGTRTRKVVEQAVIFQLKPNISDGVKENMVQGFADLKANCPKWVVAESAGLVPQSSQLEGEGVGLFMRFFSKEDLDAFFTSKQKCIMAEKYILPYTSDVITMYFEAEVDDDNEAVYRQGDAFKNGAERIVGIKVKNGTSQDNINTMIKSLNDLIDAPELSSFLIQITAGTNFCAFDQRYTHSIVVRCPSLEALHTYSKHPHHIDVISKTVWPIAESLLQADYIVDGSDIGELLCTKEYVMCTENNLIVTRIGMYSCKTRSKEAGKMMFQRGVAVILLVLTCVTICGCAPSPPPPTGAYIPSGRDKDAWPELLHMNGGDAVAALAASGLVQNIYVQAPSSGPAPTNIGLSTDVWVYTDGSVVYETPRRGVWHANRLIPGWPEVTGMDYKSAIAKIKNDYFGVTVIYGAKGSLVRTADIKMDRVFLEINNNSMVVGVPYVG